jgi:hypothetical protein
MGGSFGPEAQVGIKNAKVGFVRTADLYANRSECLLRALFTDLLARSECLETGNQYNGIRTPT